MNVIKFLNTGSGNGFHRIMVEACLIKFGEHPKKKDKTSWSPTADDYANKLLDKFVGIIINFNGSNSIRIFLRAVVANELGTYLLTGNKTPGLFDKVNELDRSYYNEGYPGSLRTKCLPLPIKL